MLGGILQDGMPAKETKLYSGVCLRNFFKYRCFDIDFEALFEHYLKKTRNITFVLQNSIT